MGMEFFERLNTTTFTDAKQSIRNTHVYFVLQYLRSDLAISQISWEVLLGFAKVPISHRRYCVFQTCCLEALWKLRILKMQYVRYEMLDVLWCCNTFRMDWAILTCHALLRRPFPRHKLRYYLRRVTNIENLPFPLPDAFRHQSEVSGASLEKTVEYLDSFSDAPKRAPRAVSGLFFRLPTFSAVL